MRTRIAAIAAAFLCTTEALAAPGDIDTSWASGLSTPGRLEFDFGTAFREGTSVAFQADGKYLVTGVAWGWETFASPLLRYNANHSLDLNYGYNGQADAWGVRTQVRVMADGKAMATENIYRWIENPAHLFYRDVVLARYNADGTTDTTFGAAGRSATFDATSAGGEQRLNTFAVLPSGKFIAAGYAATTGGNSLLLLVRYNADGSLDGTFGTGGVVKFSLLPGASFQEIRSIDVDTAGNMVVAGIVESNRGFWQRLDANGAILAQGQNYAPAPGECNAVKWTGVRWLIGCGIQVNGTGRRAYLIGTDALGGTDVSFNSTFTTMGSDQDAWRGIAVAADGKIYATGVGGAGRLAIAAFESNGAPITAFGTSGVYLMPETDYTNGAGIAANATEVVATGRRYIAAGLADHDMPIVRLARTTGVRSSVTYVKRTSSSNGGGLIALPDGKLLAGGTSGVDGTPHFDVVRLMPNGFPDSAWGGVGYTTLAVPHMDFLVGVRDMSLQSDGKVLVTGDLEGWFNGQMRIGAARFSSAGPDTGFNATGPIPGIGYAVSGGNVYFPNFSRAVRVQADGKVVAAGSGLSNTGIRQIAVSRLNTDGTVDMGYGTSGVARTDLATAVTGRSMDLMPDGSAVAIGDSGGTIKVVRFTGAGVLDPAFGTAGVFTFPMPAGFTLSTPNRVVVHGGKIVVVASVFTTGGVGMMALRLTSTGALDPTFGEGNGWSFVSALSAAGATGNFFAGIVMPNGKIVAAGITEGTTQRARGVVVRMNPNGGADTSFGTGGVRHYDARNSIGGVAAVGYYEFTAIAPAVDGGMFLGGALNAGAEHRSLMMKTVAEAASGSSLTDLDGDGKSDLLWRNSLTGQVYRMRMNGMAIASQGFAYNEPDTSWRIIADADFNGDGITDLLWRNVNTGQLYYMPFDSNAMPTAGSLFYTEANPAWKIVHTPDLDGDGRADLLWWNSTTGQVYAMLMNGGTITAQGMVYTEPNTSWRIQVVGDFSGTGKSNQLLYYNIGTGQVYQMTISYSAGAFSQTGAFVYSEPNLQWSIVGAPDFDGDGKNDLLWRNAATGQVWGMLMNGSAISSQGQVHHEPNLAWKIVSFGDYDGNGKSDLLWRNETDGRIYMMLMNGLAIGTQGMVYTEPNAQWELMGPVHYQSH